MRPFSFVASGGAKTNLSSVVVVLGALSMVCNFPLTLLIAEMRNSYFVFWSSPSSS